MIKKAKDEKQHKIEMYGFNRAIDFYERKIKKTENISKCIECKKIYCLNCYLKREDDFFCSEDCKKSLLRLDQNDWRG